MTATPFGWAATNTVDSLTNAGWSTSLYSLTNGSASVSAAIDNTEATVGTAAFTEAALVIDLGASTSLGTSGLVQLSAVPIDCYDGTNYQPSFVASGTLYPLDRQRIQTFPISISARYLIVRDLFLYPVLFKIAIVNNTGVTWPSSGVVASLYRFRPQSG